MRKYHESQVKEATENGDDAKRIYHEYRLSVLNKDYTFIDRYTESELRAVANRFRDDTLGNKVDRKYRRYVGD